MQVEAIDNRDSWYALLLCIVEEDISSDAAIKKTTGRGIDYSVEPDPDYYAEVKDLYEKGFKMVDISRETGISYHIITTLVGRRKKYK
jgi:hypothetical protein